MRWSSTKFPHTDPASLLPAVSEPFVCGVQNCKFRRKQRHPVKAINRKFVGLMVLWGLYWSQTNSLIFMSVLSPLSLRYFVLGLTDQTGKMGDGVIVVAIIGNSGLDRTYSKQPLLRTKRSLAYRTTRDKRYGHVQMHKLYWMSSSITNHCKKRY